VNRDGVAGLRLDAGGIDADQPTIADDRLHAVAHNTDEQHVRAGVRGGGENQANRCARGRGRPASARRTESGDGS
jgi:hypothetical protein